jgi:Flp pilus assembly protein TadG
MMARRARDGGSLAIEYVIVAPLFLIVFALIFAYARVVELDGLLDAGARDAARAVSIDPDLSATSVHDVAVKSVAGELGQGAGGCDSKSVSVTVVGLNAQTLQVNDTGDLHPGDIARVTVTCTYSLSDLGLPIPGLSGLTSTSVFASIVDPNRSVTDQ